MSSSRGSTLVTISCKFYVYLSHHGLTGIADRHFLFILEPEIPNKDKNNFVLKCQPMKTSESGSKPVSILTSTLGGAI
jgi:hypothetical protein